MSRLSKEDISKRLSLPADLHLPENLLTKNSPVSAILEGQPLTRNIRRQSLVRKFVVQTWFYASQKQHNN